MHAKHMILVTILAAILLLSSSSNTTVQDFSDEILSVQETDIVSIIDNVPLYVIDHVDNFTQFGFTGSGTEVDPFVLEDQDYSYSLGDIFQIKSQSVHYRFENCNFSASGNYNAIYAEDSGNGTILNCRFESHSYGINLYNSNSSLVDDCAFKDCTAGVYLYLSYNVDVINCEVEESSYGVRSYASPNCTVCDSTFDDVIYGFYDTNQLSFFTVIDNNTITNTRLDYSAIYVTSTYTNVTNNLIVNTSYLGIYALYGSYMLVENNTLYNTGNHAIQLELTDDAIICNNHVCNTSYRGIHINTCDSIEVDSNVINTCSNGHDSIYAQDVTYSWITNNRMHHAGYGITLSTGCDDNEIFGNHLSNHTTNDAYDNTGNTNNLWDDSSSIGNYYSTSHSAPYAIPGGTGNVDDYPAELQDNTNPTITDLASTSVDEDKSLTLEWDVDDLHPWNYTLYRDGNRIRNGCWVSSVPFSYTVSGLTPGVYNYQLSIMDAFMNEAVDEVELTVNDVDTEAPQITGPSDFAMEAGSNKWINWTFYELNPDVIELFIDNVSQFVDDYSDSYNESLMNLYPGKHNFTLVANDTLGLVSIDTVFVTVSDTTAPTVSGDTEIWLEYDVADPIIFIVSDFQSWDSTGVYKIFENGTEVKDDGAITSSGDIQWTLSQSALGRYNVTIWVFDAHGNNATFMTWVNLQDTTVPSVSSPEDISFTNGTTGNWIDWTCSDSLPESYSVLKNGTQIISGDWDGSDIEFNADSLGVGVWNITLVLVDSSGNAITDTVIVTVTEEATTTTTTTTTTTSTTTTDETTTTTTTPPPSGIDPMILALVGGSGAAIVVIVVLYFVKLKK